MEWTFLEPVSISRIKIYLFHIKTFFWVFSVCLSSSFERSLNVSRHRGQSHSICVCWNPSFLYSGSENGHVCLQYKGFNWMCDATITNLPNMAHQQNQCTMREGALKKDTINKPKAACQLLLNPSAAHNEGITSTWGVTSLLAVGGAGGMGLSRKAELRTCVRPSPEICQLLYSPFPKVCNLLIVNKN